MTESTVASATNSTRWWAYLKLARFSHWWKNLLVLWGTILAISSRLDGVLPSVSELAVALVSTGCLASGNYVLNEILDQRADANHPQKKFRGLATGILVVRIAVLMWAALYLAGLVLAAMVNPTFFLLSITFVAAALLYNVPPIRLKDWPAADILCEAINSPLRVWLGWSLVRPDESPGFLVLLGFWLLGTAAMAMKRRWELPVFTSTTIATQYRKSFAYYTAQRLQLIEWSTACGAIACFVQWFLSVSEYSF